MQLTRRVPEFAARSARDGMTPLPRLEFRGTNCTLDTAARRVPEFAARSARDGMTPLPRLEFRGTNRTLDAADAASFKDSVGHCALTHLHFFFMISKAYRKIFRPKF
jgi:hypothetical protein